MIRIPFQLEHGGEAGDETLPTKKDMNWVVMDYLISEGYPLAAEKFAQESNIPLPTGLESVRERVRIRNAIHAGRIDEAIALINDFDPEILDTNPLLHFRLLQLQLIEIIRVTLDDSITNNRPVAAAAFLPAIQFATEQLSPRASTDPAYQSALEHTMALMIFPPEKMTPEFKALLDLGLRSKIASDVNAAVLSALGQRGEAKIRKLVRARAWAEAQAHEMKMYEIPSKLPFGLNPEEETMWYDESPLSPPGYTLVYVDENENENDENSPE